MILRGLSRCREVLTNLLDHLLRREVEGGEREVTKEEVDPRQFQVPSMKVKQQMRTLSGMILRRRGEKLMGRQILLHSPSHFDFQEVHGDRGIYECRTSSPTEYWKEDEVSR